MKKEMNKARIKHRFLISLAALLLGLNSSTSGFAAEQPGARIASTLPSSSALSPQADEAARLLGIENEVHRFIQLKNSGKIETFDVEALRLQLGIIRRVMSAGLELRTVSAHL